MFLVTNCYLKLTRYEDAREVLGLDKSLERLAVHGQTELRDAGVRVEVAERDELLGELARVVDELAQVGHLPDRLVHDRLAAVLAQVHRRVLDRDEHPDGLRRIEEEHLHEYVGEGVEDALLRVADARDELRIDGEKGVGGHPLERIGHDLVGLEQDLIELRENVAIGGGRGRGGGSGARGGRGLARLMVVEVGAEVEPQRHHARQRLIDVLAAVLERHGVVVEYVDQVLPELLLLADVLADGHGQPVGELGELEVRLLGLGADALHLHVVLAYGVGVERAVLLAELGVHEQHFGVELRVGACYCCCCCCCCVVVVGVVEELVEALLQVEERRVLVLALPIPLGLLDEELLEVARVARLDLALRVQHVLIGVLEHGRLARDLGQAQPQLGQLLVQVDVEMSGQVVEQADAHVVDGLEVLERRLHGQYLVLPRLDQIRVEVLDEQRAVALHVLRVVAQVDDLAEAVLDLLQRLQVDHVLVAALIGAAARLHAHRRQLHDLLLAQHAQRVHERRLVALRRLHEQLANARVQRVQHRRAASATTNALLHTRTHTYK